MGLRTLIHMDDPAASGWCARSAHWFSPEGRLAGSSKSGSTELAKIYVDKMVAAGGDVSEVRTFVQEVAVNLPALRDSCPLLGLCRSRNFPRMPRADSGTVRRRR